MLLPPPSPSVRVAAILVFGFVPALASAAPLAPDAQNLEPALDGTDFVAVDVPRAAPAFTGGGSVLVHHAHAPLVLRYTDGRPELPLVSDLSTAELSAWLHVPYARFGMSAPIHMAVEGYDTTGARPLGDLRLDAVGLLPELGRFQAGVAVFGRLPTGDETSWLGAPAAVLGSGLRVGTDLGPLALGLTGGLRTAGGASIGTAANWKVQVDSGLGVGVDLTERVGLASELVAALQPAGVDGDRLRLESLGSVRVRTDRGLQVRVGGGAGLAGGPGEADWRVFAGLTWSPGGDPEASAHSPADLDGDGIANAADQCVDQPEDRNGVRDDDGCPDGGLTITRLDIVDRRGRLLTDAHIELVEGSETGAWRVADGSWVRALAPGSFVMRVQAPGHATRTVSVDVPESADEHARRVALDRHASTGTVRLSITDPSGRAVPASVQVRGPDGAHEGSAPSGTWDAALPVGAWSVRISAPGFNTVDRAVTLEEGGTVDLSVVLSDARVRIEGGRIVLTDRIYFETGSAVIKRQSFPLLEEIAGTLILHPEITRVSVRGHTDDVGEESANLDLSLERAQAVVRFLVASDVDADRLQAMGFGEAQPLIEATSPDARAANRRVEFHITQRTDAPTR